MVHYSYGDYTAREPFDSDLPDDLVSGVWRIVEPNAEEWRAMGVFGPAVDVADDAPLQDRLLALTARRP